MSKDSWGTLGKPPAWVLEGNPSLIARYKKYLAEEKAILKLTSKSKAVKLAELRVRFQREFPENKPGE